MAQFHPRLAGLVTLTRIQTADDHSCLRVRTPPPPLLLPTSHWLAGSRPSNFTTALHSPSHHRTRGRSAGHWTPRPALGNERDSNSADLCCVERCSAVWNAAKDTRNNQQLPRLQHILARGLRSHNTVSDDSFEMQCIAKKMSLFPFRMRYDGNGLCA